jgi:hypothetical protein
MGKTLIKQKKIQCPPEIAQEVKTGRPSRIFGSSVHLLSKFVVEKLVIVIHPLSLYYTNRGNNHQRPDFNLN